MPSTRQEYRKLCAVLHNFHEERFWTTDYIEPSRADSYQPTMRNVVTGAPLETFASGAVGLMDYWLQRHFPLLVKDWGADRLPRPPFPLVRNVVQSKAVAFKEQVTVDLVNEATGESVTDIPIAKTLTKRLRETGWFAAMRRKETMAVLYRTAASHYKVEQGEMVVSALAPFAFDAEAWPAAPDDPSRAASIQVPLGGMAYVDEPDKEPRYNYKRIPGTPASYRASVVDEKGQPMAALPEAPTGEIETGCYPVVIWKEGESPGIYAAPPQSLYAAQVNIILELINSTVGVRGGAHGTTALSKQRQDAAALLRTAGVDTLDRQTADDKAKGDDVIRFPTGIQSIFRVPDGYEAAVLQSRVDPEKYAKWVQALIKLAYIAEDMAPGSVDLINPPPSNVSGKARLQEQMPRLLAKSRREAALREMALADLEVWRAYWNFLAPESEHIPAGVGFRIQFSEILSPDALTDQSTIQAIEGAAGMGLTDLVKLRQQIDQSSYDEAKVAFWKSAGTYKRTKEPLPAPA